MAVAQGYGKTVTSGSVFAYDVADTRNSYIGEPTVNQYTNPDFSNGTTGWAFDSWDGNVTYTTEAVTGPFGKTINALKLTKNATSVYSHFHQYNSGKYTTGNQYTLSAWVKGTGTFRGNTQWGGIVQSFTLTGDWQYVQYTVTAPNNGNFPYWAAEALTTGTVFYMVYAQSEQKSHATPFVNGTRSATQGLLPLIGNSTIDLSNVSFDSNAKITFDGTDDGVPIYSGRNLSSYTEMTYEFILKGTGVGNYDRFFSGTSGETVHYPDLAINSSGLLRYIHSSQGTGWVNTGVNIPTTTYVHINYTFSNNGNVKLYINGVLIYTANNSSGTFPSIANAMVGNRWDRNGEAFVGEIPVVKIYNRALSAAEIKQNYLHYKTRFNLS
jgi:hypothetical protein